VTYLSLFIPSLLLLAAVSALSGALSTLRGSAVASAEGWAENLVEGPQCKGVSGHDRLMVTLRLVWSILFAAALGSGFAFFAFGRGPAAERTALLSLAILLVGDLVPAYAGRRYPTRVASLFARPAALLVRLFSLGGAALHLGLQKWMPGESLQAGAEASHEEEIRVIAQEISEAGRIEEGERQILRRVFALGDKPVASVMTPRSSVVSLRTEDSVERALELAARTRLLFFPVAGDSEDEIIGTASLHALVELSHARNSCIGSLLSCLSPVFQVPESMSALELLELMRARGEYFALVVDEYGVFAGVVTIRDVLEVLVGDLSGSGEREARHVVRGDGSHLIDATSDVDEVFCALGLRPTPAGSEGSFHSLGGFVICALGRIPAVGEWFEALGYRFEVAKMDGKRIQTVLVTAVLPARAAG